MRRIRVLEGSGFVAEERVTVGKEEDEVKSSIWCRQNLG